MFYPEGLVDFASEKSFIPKLSIFLLHICVQNWLFAKYCPHFSFITLLVVSFFILHFFHNLAHHYIHVTYSNEGNEVNTHDPTAAIHH